MPNFSHRVRKQNDITTDCILPEKYKFNTWTEKELAQHVFENTEEAFHEKVKEGDFFVAGANFGCGPSREQAALALKATGLRAVIAKSYDRIFYRNAVNAGLCLLECETNYIDDMDELDLDAEKNILFNRSKGVNFEVKPMPVIMRKFMASGGVIEYLKQYGDFEDLV